MSSSTKKHDVFLSFRGEDIRINFISHLYSALKTVMNAFIDDKLPRGEDVWRALSKAIEDSHISVVVFSENYASSKWCLKELVKILECRKDHGQVVIPVFYNTDPSDIRKQTGTYETAFAKHERDLCVEDSESNKQKVLKWRAALSDAADISGWDSRNHKDDSQLIHNVVKDVSQKLDLRYPIDLEGIVGSGKICKKVESLMKKHQVIGIWGMPGVGKTTIAKVLFAKLFPQYDNICFVVNAKEFSLDKILSELLKEEISESNVLGSTPYMRRLSGKKVFIVLDDVNSSDLLEDLRRAYSHLSQDSRLVITTRDKQLLSRRVDYIYKVKNWKATESLKLFSLEAFNQSCPQNGYHHLSKRVVDYAGGVPLALKFLGSYLRSKPFEFWESTLRKINNYNIVTIQNLLEVSYDGLDGPEKKIFLDIAFFFIGKMKDHVIKILDACDFEASSGIEVLEDKALITISPSNRIQMHNLLKKMALEIVRMEDEENPEGRSRLRHSEAREVIEKNKGTKAIQGITLDLSQITALPLRADTFTKMEALRFLKFCNPLDQSSSNTYLKLATVLEPFSDKLRYVEWIGYPFESLPHLFSAKFLVEIRMPHSNVKQLWQGTQELHNLEGIDLSECNEFENLPDLSKASRLKWVNLSGCVSFCDLHHSVLSADTLVTLILDRCITLKSVKGKKHLKSLETISVSGCLRLEEFAVSSDLIENLDLRKTGIQSLDTSIGLIQNLKWLNLEGLRLTHLPNELFSLKSLKELKLSYSGLVIDKKQLNDLFDGLRSLQILHLKDCSNLFEVPDNIWVLSQLQELRLDGSNVISLPTSIKDLERLEILSLENCRKLQYLPELPPSIKQLYAINCASLKSVPNLKTCATKMMGSAKHISFKNSLKLDEHSLKRIMESLHLTMMSAAAHNVLVRRLRVAVHNYNYNSLEVCLRGDSVPRKMKYRTTDSSITIKLPNRSSLFGFIYSVVLSPAGGVKKHGTKIKCQCHFSETASSTVTWLNTDIMELNSDYVYVWYDPFHCDNILQFYEPKVRFDFCVANDKGEVDGSICIKECGVCLISVSDLHSVLPKLDLGSDNRKALEKGLELESGRSIMLTSIEGSYEKESNGSSEQSSSDETDSDSEIEMVEPDSAEEGNGRKDHYSDEEESIKSTRNGLACKENTAESAVKSERNKPNGLHEPAELLLDKENESKEKSIAVELESVQKDKESRDHFSDVEESIGSTRNEMKTRPARGLKENTTKSTKVVKSKGNKATPAEPGARLHELIESQPDKENASKNKSIVEPKSMVGELESAEEDNGRKGHFPDLEESIGSIPKETKTSVGSSPEENNTNSTHDVKSKENKGTSTKSDAILYELVESQPDKKKSKDKSKSAAEEDNRMKDHFSDVEESIRYSHNQTKTSAVRGCKENTTKSTKAVKIKEGMHLPAVTIDKESENASTDKSSENNADWPNNIEEAKQSEEYQNLQGGDCIVPFDSHDRSVEEKENEPMEVDKHEGQQVLDEDHFAELDSILLEISRKSSAIATPSTSDVALNNLHCLLKNSLESIQGDVELQRQLGMSLECIEQASDEKVSPNVAKLVESMTSSIKDLFKDYTLTQKVVVDHTIRLQQKDELEKQGRDVKKRHELVNKEMSQCGFETERLVKEAKMLNEKIRILIEQEKTVELKKAKCMETLERCDFERKKLHNEAKNWISERKEIMSSIEKYKSSYDAALSEREKLNDKWEGFKTAFAENCKPPVSHNT